MSGKTDVDLWAGLSNPSCSSVAFPAVVVVCYCWPQQTDLCLSAYLDHNMSMLYLVFARELYSAAAASYNLQSLYHMYHKLKGSLGVLELHAYTKKMLGVCDFELQSTC